MEEIVHPENLNAAWEQVRRNHGAPGVGSAPSSSLAYSITKFEGFG